jgi:N6-L-threonylcarbamoyladenine synthase
MSDILMLGIESSCDDTAAAVIRNRTVLSSIVADQEVHRKFGGVVPELASRAHQQNIIPVVDAALKEAGCDIRDLSAIAFTRGPGLLGSLLVGTSFAKGVALAAGIPLIEVNHLQAHILVHFLQENGKDSLQPAFPFICLLVSGGHTELVVVRDTLDMEVAGRTIDDAAGEAFDKCAKIMGIPYPGGPLVDKIAAGGNPDRFAFARPRVEGYNFSYSGVKTSFLYFVRDRVREDPGFINRNISDLCASVQKTIVELLLEKLTLISGDYGIREIALAGGVAANSALRAGVNSLADKYHWKVYIPPVKFTTDNAAMIAIAGYYKFLKGAFAGLDVSPAARLRY